MAHGEKQTGPIHHHPEQVDLAAEDSLNFWTHRIRPHVRNAAYLLAAVVVILAVLATLHSRRQARNIAAYGALDAATTPEQYAKVAAEYADTAAGAEALLARGRSLMETGKYAEAASGFADFIRQHPASPRLSEAQAGQAYATESAGKTAEAEKLFAALGDAKATSNANAAADAFLGAARCAQIQKKPAESEKWLKRALSCGGTEAVKARVLTALAALPPTAAK